MQFKMETFRAFIPEYRRMQGSGKPEATQISASIQSQNNINKLKDEFVTIKKNRGLFEKTYDFCKNLTSFGTGYKKIEKGVVEGYKKIEQGVVGGYTKLEDKFVDAYLTKDGETVEEAKARLKDKNK